MTFAVVIPAHNAAATIDAAVGSALAQRTPPSEIVVVADACTDDTTRRAAALGARVLEVNVRSPGAARNIGIEATGATHVAFLDADDIWLPTWLEAVDDARRRAPHAALYYGAVVEESARGAAVRVGPRASREGDVFETLLGGNFIATPACVCARAALRAHGPFDASLRYAEDWDLWLRLAVSGRVAAVPGHHVHVRRVPNSVSRNPAHLLRSRDDALLVIERAARLRPVAPEVLRRARGRVLAQSAMRLLVNDAAEAARIDLRSALELAPTDVELWLMSLLSVVPPSWRRALVHLRRRLRLVGEQP